MFQNKNKINVIIATDQYLIRVGIQSIIHHIGIEPSYINLRKLDDIDIEYYCENDYLIVHHKILNKPKTQHIRKLNETFKGKLLILGNEMMNQLAIRDIIYPEDSKTKTVEKFQNFFSTIRNEETIPENGVISTREIDILKEVALGYSNKEIADRLFISINTVITHRKNLTEKLGIKTISGLTVYALMNNLINPDDVTT